MAEFRAGTAAMRDEPPVIDLVDRLHRGQPEFAEWWREHDVAQFQTRLRRYPTPVPASWSSSTSS